jgi:hypothetical protein
MEYAVINAERTVEICKGELLYIIAVERVMKIVNRDTMQIIEIIFFTDADKQFKKGYISMRIHKRNLKYQKVSQQYTGGMSQLV